MITLCFVNQKGGVGKTTSCLNIGAALAKQGKRVLLIDMDAQGSLTKSAGIGVLPQNQPTISEVLGGKATAEEAILKEQGSAKFDVLPSDIRLSGAEVELIGAAGRDFILREALEPVADRYDYALIDCSPSLNILTLMALTAATGLVIPVAAQYMPLDGIMQLLQTVDIVRKRMNPTLKISGVVVTLYDSRRSLDRSIYEAIKQRFEKEIFEDIVRYNSKIAEAPTFGKDVITYAPSSNGSLAYQKIAEEIIRREET
ncbi:MAG: ParA family protein [Oscillospiraceae bacterium]|nr:ParA family protein [Oscillospiraceae bacterium]